MFWGAAAYLSSWILGTAEFGQLLIDWKYDQSALALILGMLVNLLTALFFLALIFMKLYRRMHSFVVIWLSAISSA